MKDTFALIETLELEIATQSSRKNSARLAQLLADDFQEFGKSGKIYSKEQIIALLSDEAPREIALSNFTFKALANDAVLVTYQSSSNGISANRSSIWIKRDGQDWQLLHHQGTVRAK